MKVLSPERMAKCDDYAIKTWGIPSAVLMENAGRNTYRLMKKACLEGKKRIVIVCGRGNNGGDGFVVARYALMDGFSVRTFLLGERQDLKGDAALNMGLYNAIGGETVAGGFSLSEFTMAVRHADVVVDAIFGTGLSKPVSGLEESIVHIVNENAKRVIAVDIPSGIDGKTGNILGAAVRADYTYTYAYPKIGQIVCPGAYHAGHLTVIDISIPEIVEKSIGYDAEIIDGDMIRSFLKTRLPWQHKGSFGHAVVIAGSAGKTGAAHMTAEASLRVGAGLVTLIIPKSLNAIMEVKLTEAMTFPVEDDGAGFFRRADYDDIAGFLRDKSVVMIGPGLGQKAETQELVRRIYTGTEMPLVIDADGINAFQDNLEKVREAKAGAVFTPHPGELGRLIDRTPAEINADRIDIGKKFAGEHRCVLVLKGARTLIFTPDGEVFINPTGNAALAKGGSGDILTGLIGGLISQGYSPKEAALLGTYLHGYIADSRVEICGADMDLVAMDLLAGVGTAIKEMRDGEDRIYIEKSL